jgi:hypothetical protein
MYTTFSSIAIPTANIGCLKALIHYKTGEVCYLSLIIVLKKNGYQVKVYNYLIPVSNIYRSLYIKSGIALLYV